MSCRAGEQKQTQRWKFKLTTLRLSLVDSKKRFAASSAHRVCQRSMPDQIVTDVPPKNMFSDCRSERADIGHSTFDELGVLSVVPVHRQRRSQLIAMPVTTNDKIKPTKINDGKCLSFALNNLSQSLSLRLRPVFFFGVPDAPSPWI
jgi:hypothetical protein